MTLNFPRFRGAYRRRHVLAACVLPWPPLALPRNRPLHPLHPLHLPVPPSAPPPALACRPPTPSWASSSPRLASRVPQVPARVGCHGADGMGVATFPRLAGTGVHYLSEQLQALADGRRNNATMSPIAKAMTDAERAGAALYFSRPARPWYAPAVAADDPGAWLATRGRWADGIPACASCHGPAGQGVGDSFPPLAGLPQAYIEEQLAAWQNAGRPEGPMDLMRGVAARLKPADVKAVAAYYSGFSATPAAAAATAAASAPATAASGAKP